MRIAIGNDHAGVEMKMAVKAHLEERGIEVVNMGTDSSESCDYPIYGERIGRGGFGNRHLRHRCGDLHGSRQGKRHPRLCVQ